MDFIVGELVKTGETRGHVLDKDESHIFILVQCTGTEVIKAPREQVNLDI